VGDDPEGNRAVALLEAEGADVVAIRQTDKVTPFKTRVIANGTHLLRLDRETTDDLSVLAEEELLAFLPGAVSSSDVVLVSDYCKGVCTARVMQVVLGLAHRASIPVVVDSKRLDVGRYFGATAMTPNEVEICALIGEQALTRALLDRVRVEHGLRWLVVTLGPHGLFAVGPSGEQVRLAALADEVVDVGGAGDALAATMACLMARGVEMARTLQISSAVAALTLRDYRHKRVSVEDLCEKLRRGNALSSDIDKSMFEFDIIREA
jgi:D-beta-D-heptose 7-phosphate kinase/D-beta-D-heptose 1-phosphate adenosyltransferase